MSLLKIDVCADRTGDASSASGGGVIGTAESTSWGLSDAPAPVPDIRDLLGARGIRGARVTVEVGDRSPRAQLR